MITSAARLDGATGLRGPAFSMLESVLFNASGLVPVITQDASSGDVLMFAWMNREALLETASTGRAVYFSRSRSRLWRKGEESGHVQHVRELRLDCDGDVLLMRVDQVGGIACHTGRANCFFRKLDEAGQWQVTDAPIRSPASIYSGAAESSPEDGASSE